MRINKKYTILVAFVLAFALPTRAYIVLPDVISDNMVLQQKSKTTLWGEATPDKEIVITPLWSSKPYTTHVSSSGKWSIEIETPSAGGPYTIKFDDGDTRTIKNVMVGELWYCSGQSNMEMNMAGRGKIENYKEEIANAEYPLIRIIKIKKTISAHPLTDVRSNSMGWQECSPVTIAEDFSAAAYFFARNLHLMLPNVAIGLIDATWGGSIVESWSSAAIASKGLAFADTLKRYSALRADTQFKDPNKPALLFNGMVHPFLHVAFRGVIWYQGESNNRKAYQYRELFPFMIEDWRKQFGRPDMPFLYVQLANYMAVMPEPQGSTWAELREAQSMALSLPNTGMAVTIDIGEANDIHPKNKQEVGRRLALIASAKVYNQNVVYQGPIYRDYKIEGNKVVLTFEKDKTGLKTKGNGELKGFAIAGSDKIFYWASAEIKDNIIIVTSDNVRKPVAVRYAWANNPVCNLINGAGLPASPFRTDDWPGLTITAK